MSQAQRTILASIAIGALLAVTLMVLIVLSSMLSGSLSGDTLPGSAYLQIMAKADDIGVLFGTAIVAITMGTSLLGRAATKTWLVYASSISCVVALLACLWLFLQLGDADVARPMWSRAERIMTYEQLQAEHRHLIKLLAAWLGAFLLTQLGIRAARGGEAPPTDARPTGASTTAPTQNG